MARKEEMTIAEEELAFFFYVGSAITEWALVENTLRSVVLACFENRGEEDLTHRALSVGFLSIETFRARMDFAEGLVLRKFPQHGEAWTVLVKRTRRASAERNKLAHWVTHKYPDSNPGRRLMLVPWVFQKKKRRSKKPLPPDGSQGLRDIVKMQLEFIALAHALHNFCFRVQGQPEQHSKDREQPARPPLIAALRVQILERLARQLQSYEPNP